MTSKTKKILLIVCAVLVIAGAIVGIVYDVTPTVDPETTEQVADSTANASDSTVVEVIDTTVVDSVAE